MRWAVLLAALLLPGMVGAQPLRVELKIIPEGRRVDVDHETYQAFNLGEYKELLKVDTELFESRRRLKLYKALDATNTELVVTKDKLIKSLRGDLKYSKDRSREMWESFQQTQRRLLESEGKREFAYLVAVGGVAAAVVSLGALAIVLGVGGG